MDDANDNIHHKKKKKKEEKVVAELIKHNKIELTHKKSFHFHSVTSFLVELLHTTFIEEEEKFIQN